MRTWAFRMGYLLVPFGFLAIGPLRQGHQVALFFMAFILLASLVRSRWLKAFLIYVLGYSLFIRIAVVFFNDLSTVYTANLAAQQFTYLVYGLALYVGVSRLNLQYDQVANIICIGAVVQMVIAGVQAVSFFFFDKSSFCIVFWFIEHVCGLPVFLDHRVYPFTVGTLQNPNFLSIYLVMSAPFFMRGKWRWFLIPMAVFLFTCKTSTAILAVLVGAGFYVWKTYRVKPRYIAAGSLAALLFVTWYIFRYDQTMSGGPAILSDVRWGFWAVVLQTIFAKPLWFLLGIGPGGYFNPQWHQLHNDWLQVWVEYGSIGLLLTIGYVVSLPRRNVPAFTAFIIGAICMLGNYPTRLAPSALLIITILAVLERERERGQLPDVC